MPANKFKKLPHFKDEDEERNFWATHSSTDYVDWDKAELVRFPNLKLTDFSSQHISMRMPTKLLNFIKKAAKKRDVPYQSLIKTVLYEVFSPPAQRLSLADRSIDQYVAMSKVNKTKKKKAA